MRSAILLAATLAVASASHALAGEPDWARVDQVLGRAGIVQAAGVHRYGFPRTDLTVTHDGVTLRPAFALGGWVAFLPTGSEAMLMGDLVLTPDEVSPVMLKLIEGGLEVSALHNHLLRTSPALFYMHVGGHGDPVRLAESLRAGIALSKTPLSAASPPAGPAPALALDSAKMDAAMGYKGSVNGGVLQYSVPRAEAVRESGMAIPPQLGTATAINFQPLGAGRAAITGDFVLLGSEVTPVLRQLRQNGIEVTAIHSHMVNDSPHLIFMHFWAMDDATVLARKLRAALDLTNSKRSP
ncbi:MAG: DUF1259 domain-containing protein [Gammaproteobacteria bacterium]|nr:DUF1259 domain-containing protein [Gammaproteobacteria bacterium]MDE2250117.1 DUF1259 domain-containing protein [Gammaproteobacteria bacterium]